MSNWTAPWTGTDEIRLINATPVSFLTQDMTTHVLTVSPVNLESADVTGNIVNTFNTRVGDVVLTQSDVTTALGFFPGTGTVTSVGINGADGIDVQSGSPVTGSGNITLGLANITPDTVNGLTLAAQTSGFDISGGSINYTLQVRGNTTLLGGSVSGTNTGDQTITLTGDVTGSGTGSFAATLATVNSNVGTFGGAANIPTFTVNAKGLITSASNVPTTSITTLGTITSGTWNATTIDVAYGGTGQTSYTNGQLLIGNTTGNTLTKATLTGTADQVTVTNGAGSITLSLPQSIGTSNDVLFKRLALGNTFSISGDTNAHLFHAESTTSQGAIASLTGYGGEVPAWRGLKCGGSPSSRTATIANSILVGLEAQGHTGSAWTAQVSKIYIRAAQTFEAGKTGTYMQIQHTPIDSAVTAVYQRLTSVGLYIGGDVSPTQPLDIYGLFKVDSSGNVTTGQWHGTTIAEAYGGTNQSTYALGDTLYSSATNTLSKLAGNTTTTKRYLSQTGDGVNSAAPSWATIAFTELTGGTAGSIIYSNGTNLTQDNSNLFFDDTNKRLGIANGAPNATLHATVPDATFGGATSFVLSTSANTYELRAGVSATSGYAWLGSTQRGVSARPLYLYGTPGVGINVVPVNALDVNGGVAIGTYAGVNTAPSGGAIISGQVGIKTTALNNTAIGLQVGSSGSSTFDIALDGTATAEKRILFYTGASGKWALGTGPSTDVFDLADFGTGASRFAVDKTTGYVGLGTTAPETKLQLHEEQTLGGDIADGYTAALTCRPFYTASTTTRTVTRHNYMNVKNISLSGTAAVTDAAVMRFDAAAGTHKAIDAGTTKTSPGTVSAWVKININGTIYYVPSYTSKTT